VCGSRQKVVKTWAGFNCLVVHFYAENSAAFILKSLISCLYFEKTNKILCPGLNRRFERKDYEDLKSKLIVFYHISLFIVLCV
jgi:hypothetical protein